MAIRTSSFIIGFLIVSFMFAGFYAFTGDLDEHYGASVDTTYSNTFDKTQNVSRDIKDNYEVVFGNSDDNETGWFVDKTSFLGLIPHSLSLVKNMMKLPFTIIGEIFGSAIFTLIGFEDFVYPFIFAVVIIAVLFGLIALINKYRYA